MELKEKLKTYRESRGWTQNKMASIIGIGETTYKNYELGLRTPQTSTIELMRQKLNLPYQYLVDDNCTNITTENIEINKKLGLSDKAIENISSLKDSSNLFALNYLLENIDIALFSDNLLSFIRAKKVIRVILQFEKIRKLFPLLDYYKKNNDIEKIEKIINYFKSLEEELYEPVDGSFPEQFDSSIEIDPVAEIINNNINYLVKKYTTNEELIVTYELEDGTIIEEPLTYSTMNSDLQRSITGFGYHRYLCSRVLEELLSNIEGFDSPKELYFDGDTDEIKSFLKEQDKLIKEKKIKRSKNK